MDSIAASSLFTPPLLNSANPWATTKEDLQALHDCPYTGAVTIRTSLLRGFSHDDTVHQYCFFDTDTSLLSGSAGTKYNDTTPSSTAGPISSLNTLGYSPITLQDYLVIVQEIYQDVDLSTNSRKRKPIVFSVTGSVADVVTCYSLINALRCQMNARLLMEINLSCPNIVGKPPPAYSRSELSQYLAALQAQMTTSVDVRNDRMEVGIKTPPYTYQDQFDNLILALLDGKAPAQRCPITFITGTNTLGNCLILDSSDNSLPALKSSNGSGLGGLAGASLHPLALGNVRTIRSMLDSHPELKDIDIIGVRGVGDGAGFRRMRCAGAAAVAVGTALGSQGIDVFKRITGGKVV
ncbi:dihydroorotate dehydrogenase [Toensbergia leucococca]|nr:dihydroorotate dehydrogenase [Toensbergia leucococca]